MFMLSIPYILEQQGLSSQEAKVYLCALELWHAPASQIARKLNENRVTVYSILQWLVKKNIILEMTKNKVTHYIAISPQKFLEKSQEKTDMLSGIMADLLALTANDQGRPSIQVYEWVDWLKMCYEDTLNYPDSVIKAFLWYGKVEKSLKRRLNYQYLSNRLQKNIHAKVIIPWALKNNIYDYAPNVDTKAYGKLTTLKFVNDKEFSLSNEINLYGEDRILMVMFGETELIWLVIKSKMLYDTLSALFDLTWKKN